MMVFVWDRMYKLLSCSRLNITGGQYSNNANSKQCQVILVVTFSVLELLLRRVLLLSTRCEVEAKVVPSFSGDTIFRPVTI